MITQLIVCQNILATQTSPPGLRKPLLCKSVCLFHWPLLDNLRPGHLSQEYSKLIITQVRYGRWSLVWALRKDILLPFSAGGLPRKESLLMLRRWCGLPRPRREVVIARRAGFELFHTEHTEHTEVSLWTLKRGPSVGKSTQRATS